MLKKLLRDHSYDMVKMFLNQFATAIFGFALTLAAGKAENPTLRNITSVCAILFYLFLLYTMVWEIGFRDRVPVEHGKMKRQPFKGAVISLFANSLNFLLAILIMLGHLIPLEFFGTVGAFAKGAALLLEGMYTGVLANWALNSYWFMYFVIILPSVLTCGISYYLGFKDIKFTSLFNYQYPESDRDPKPRRGQKRDD